MEKRFKVVLAEDEPPILNMIIEIINESDTPFEVVGTSFNGRDALKLIKEHQPELVITDIKMPIMDGLKLIEASKQICRDTRFVILTGYSEFEYARSALKLNVFDYILKPIDNENLTSVLGKIAVKLNAQNFLMEAEYIKNKIGLGSEHENMAFALKNFKMHLLFAYAGAITSRAYGEFEQGAHVWKSKDYDVLMKIGSEYGVRIHCFQGKRFNELILAVVCLYPKSVNFTEITEKIFRWAQSESISINLAVSRKITNSSEILKSAREAASIITTNLKFGRSGVMWCEKEKQMPGALVSPELISRVDDLLFVTSREQLRSRLNKIIEYWDSVDYTQLKLQAEINYIFTIACQRHKSQKQNYSPDGGDVNDMLVQSHNYSELMENLFFELQKAIGFDSAYAEGYSGARDLIRKIKDYLDSNYTTDITYKMFYDTFGYNDKYITNLFKTEIGVSPSKYVTNLRIEKAKQLLTENPDMLLKDIAQMIGYSDQLYFSRVFKDIVGQSPSSYANR